MGFGSLEKITLVQLVHLDLAGLVGVERLEGLLPLVNVIEQLLELVHVNGAAGVLVKHICNNFEAIISLHLP